MRALLRKSHGLRGLREDLALARKLYLSGRGRAIQRYLDQAAEPALHLGANQKSFAGWLNTDVDITTSGTVYLDASKPFPLPDASFRYVYAEHMIEHIGEAAGLAMLRECRRILKPGGVLRLTTPDLAFLLKLYLQPDEKGLAYMRWIGDRFMGFDEPSAALVINNAFRAWGHQFLYDADTLEQNLRSCGFTQVSRVAYNESDHDMLRGIEQHAVNVGNEDMVKLETMIFEAC